MAFGWNLERQNYIKKYQRLLGVRTLDFEFTVFESPRGLSDSDQTPIALDSESRHLADRIPKHSAL